MKNHVNVLVLDENKAIQFFKHCCLNVCKSEITRTNKNVNYCPFSFLNILPLENMKQCEGKFGNGFDKLKHSTTFQIDQIYIWIKLSI